MDERNSEVMYRTLMEARDLHLSSLDLCERVCCVSMLCLGGEIPHLTNVIAHILYVDLRRMEYPNGQTLW